MEKNNRFEAKCSAIPTDTLHIGPRPRPEEGLYVLIRAASYEDTVAAERVDLSLIDATRLHDYLTDYLKNIEEAN